MIEIKERAQSKMETIQKTNRDKSMAKIKELTEQHKKDGKHKQPKQSKADKTMFDDLEGDNSDGGADKA
tara:strand:+ start:276 stop:482 length:207 start_codon:yes stop_codon:yes gene_type:complete